MVEHYCSHCGAKRQDISEKFCTCGKVHYDNPVPLVLCILLAGNKSLLVRRAHPPYRGLWAPPGGYVDKGETVEEAIIREVREETGIEITEDMLIPYSISSVPSMNQIYIIFRAHLNEMLQPLNCDEVEEAAWFDEEHIPIEQFWLPAHINSFKALFRSIRSGKYKFYVNQSSYDTSSARGHRLIDK